MGRPRAPTPQRGCPASQATARSRLAPRRHGASLDVGFLVPLPGAAAAAALLLEAEVGDDGAAFETTEGHLSLRLMAALDAGQAAGGDKRGMQSAAMLIVKKNGGVWLNNDVVLRLQVDDSPEPLKELRRLVEQNARRFRR